MKRASMNASDGIYIRTHLMHIDCLLFELLSEAGRMLAIEEDMDRNAFVVQPQALHTVKQLIVITGSLSGARNKDRVGDYFHRSPANMRSQKINDCLSRNALFASISCKYSSISCSR